MGTTRRLLMTAAKPASLAIAALCLPLLTACGSDGGAASGEGLTSNEAGRTVFVEATPNDCQLTKKGAPPGDITFTVRNSGDELVEFEVLSGDGETRIGRAGVGGGLVRDVVVQLEVGDFSTSCLPAGRKKPITSEFVVTDGDPGGGY